MFCNEVIVVIIEKLS